MPWVTRTHVLSTAARPPSSQSCTSPAAQHPSCALHLQPLPGPPPTHLAPGLSQGSTYTGCETCPDPQGLASLHIPSPTAVPAPLEILLPPLRNPCLKRHFLQEVLPRRQHTPPLPEVVSPSLRVPAVLCLSPPGLNPLPSSLRCPSGLPWRPGPELGHREASVDVSANAALCQAPSGS